MVNQLANAANGIVSEELEKISSGGKMDMGIQFFAKSSKDFETVILPQKEYAHVMSEIATNITADQKEMRIFTKPIGNYAYTVESDGFGEYRIIRRGKTQDKPAGYWRKLHDKNENGTI